VNTLKQIIASVQAALTRIWPWTISKTNTQKSLAPSWCELVTDVGGNNLEILDGPLTGVVFRPTTLGVIPDADGDGVRLQFNYELIHTGAVTIDALTTTDSQSIIMAVIKEYLEIR
jgi:hypothetical protein